MDTIHGDELAEHAHRMLNRSATPFADQSSIPEVFAECATTFAARTAVVHRDTRVDYRTLDRWSDLLAARLSDAGVGSGRIVGVCVRRGPGLIAGLLAVLKCGAAYLPVSGEWPDDRLRDLLDQAQCSVVLTDGGAAGPEGRLPSVRHVLVEHAVPALADLARAEPPPARIAADSNAYINFTSGSLGRPKGVLVQHRAVIRLVDGARYARLDKTRRVLHLAPVTFDAATFEIWGPLLTGGTCVLYPSEALRLSELKRVIVQHGVTTAFFTTALFNSIVDDAPDTLATLDEILTGGEAHSLKHFGLALARYGPGRLIHVYGPTESTTFASWHRIDTLPANGRPVPIGRPIQNTRAYVMDGGRLCPPGQTGELHLAGHGLSPGYLGMPDATAARFVTRTVLGVTERLYRTGDLVHLSADGDLVFEGRADDQNKINGFRIEPGEIAYHLDRHPDVRQSCVCVAERATGKALLAFVVPATGSCTAESVRQHLAAALPRYMLPAEIHLCSALPLSPTGKIDRRALVAQVNDRTVAVAAP